MSITAPTTVVEVDGTDLRTYTLRPEDVGLTTCADAGAAAGGSPEDNAATTRAIFGGEQGPRRDLAVLNAGAAIYAAGRADDLAAGVAAAQAAIDDGAATRTLDALVARTPELAPHERPRADRRRDARGPAQAPQAGPAQDARAGARRRAATTARSARR